MKHQPETRKLLSAACAAAVISGAWSSVTFAADDLPSGKSLFERHVEQSYGENGLEEHTSMTLSGTVDIVQFGIQSPVTIMKKAPDQRLTRSTIMGNDTTSVCSNGTCWERTENEGVEKIEGAELERWLEDADYDRFANIEDYAQSIETTELAEISGTEVYEVKLIDHHGNENFYYFDSDTALLARASLTVADQGGFQPRTVSYSDYETFGDFTLPTRTIEERQDTAVVTHIEEVSFAEIPDSEFAMPEELQSES